MYAARASQFAKTITMACSVQKQPSANPLPKGSSSSAGPTTPKPKIPGAPRGSLPTDMVAQPPLEFQWPPPIPVSTHTNNVRLNMMNQDPKDLHTARAMIEELRSKVRFQAEHIMKWRKAYALQVQQQYRYQKEKSDQMNALTSQLLLLESRLKRKQKQISSLLQHREMTIQRQQKIIDTLSTRLVEHGLETIDASYATELDSLNDSDSAVVLEDMDSDTNMTLIGGGIRRKGSSGGSGGGSCSLGGSGGDGITVARSISDAIETSLNKYGVVRRNNCFLRRPEILETVYSVEEDPEPTSDVAEKRDKFKQRSEKALSSSSTEGQLDTVDIATPPGSTTNGSIPLTTVTITAPEDLTKDRDQPPSSPNSDGFTTALVMRVPQLQRNAKSMEDQQRSMSKEDEEQNGEQPVKSQNPMTNYNRVMSNHRSVTKPKDVKYKRINKAKSKSLEELRGRLKNLVEKVDPVLGGSVYSPNVIPQTAQSYA
ncbi:uncharacterized protein LOC106088283 [Stomoxys calcitrans]|uniref:uncharacterized protein LOC106088283 n=1 Tax=Stomoxys calcitrans TaxID=35570 RepID=UPI0027E3662C|nr:uncharacterized protein LOC106088283 [Stomoxys calcitrans]XP_059221979.1 uncharacterized protein LOC106088283 [Stomoxys calcitrans]